MEYLFACAVVACTGRGSDLSTVDTASAFDGRANSLIPLRRSARLSWIAKGGNVRIGWGAACRPPDHNGVACPLRQLAEAFWRRTHSVVGGGCFVLGSPRCRSV
jgi:hypothetical protein